MTMPRKASILKSHPTCLRMLPCLLVLISCIHRSALSAAKEEDLWVLKPVVRPEVPAVSTATANPIDAFIAAQYQSKSLKPAGPADKHVLLRRVYLDLTGIPPTPSEQEAFLNDASPDAYNKVVDKLLSSEQHAVRYARHWLDVFRYADADEDMAAAPGIYLWRDWVINALQEDLPYDQFVRAQLTGYRSTVRTKMSATGHRSRAEPRPDDLFALGFLARGGGGKEASISDVETVSTAFMGMTVGCAKCHDHMFDPIKQSDFYAMKALFDPLVLKKVTLASAEEIVASGRAMEEERAKRAAIEEPLNALAAPYKKRLYDDRVAMLPADVQTVIRKPENERSVQEQKIADDYFPILRIDSGKIAEVKPPAERQKNKDLQKQLEEAGGKAPALKAFWTVEVDHLKELEKTCILTSGDPERPEKNHEVEPGWPFGPEKKDFREGRIEAFSDWLTAPENPLFARVAVNRLWQWHMGEGLQKTPSDFGNFAGAPSNPQLLDWLAAEFVKRRFSMKQIHRLIVTSETYKLASEAGAELAKSNAGSDPDNTFLWHFRLQRLEAEPIWDSIFAASGNLDLSVGGPSFDVGQATRKSRRAAYMIRGFSSGRDVLPNFLKAFDADDGRVPCPMRTQTVTAPQSLFMMNSPEIDHAAAQFGERLAKDSGRDLHAAVELAWRVALARPPSSSERERALSYLANDAARLKKSRVAALQSG